jgi:hypothetical protein
MAHRVSASTTDPDHGGVVTNPGFVENDIIIAAVSADGGSNGDISFPSGFTPFTEIFISGPDGQLLGAAWKRATASEPSTYIFSQTNSGGSTAIGMSSFSGRHLTNPPVAVLTSPNTSSNATPVTLSLAAATALVGDDIVGVATADNSPDSTCAYVAPTDYTEAIDIYEATARWANLGMFYRENVAAGSTGVLQPQAILESGRVAGWAGYVIRIPSASVAAPTLTDGPNVTDITATGFNVSGTADQACDVSLVVVNHGAAAPDDEDYDASAHTTSALANTEWEIEYP